MLEESPIIIQNTHSAVTLLNDNIFLVEYIRDHEIEIDDFEETRNAYHYLSKNKRLKFLVVFPDFVSVTPEARKWAEEHQVDTEAEAIVFKSLAQRIIIKFYLTFRKQQHPGKIFTSKEKAIHWLNSMP